MSAQRDVGRRARRGSVRSAARRARCRRRRFRAQDGDQQLALRWSLAQAGDCPVHLIHAWTVGGIQDFAWISRQWLRTDSRDLLRTALAAARRHADAAVEVSCHSVEGPSAAAMAVAAR